MDGSQFTIHSAAHQEKHPKGLRGSNFANSLESALLSRGCGHGYTAGYYVDQREIEDVRIIILGIVLLCCTSSSLPPCIHDSQVDTCQASLDHSIRSFRLVGG